MLRPLDPDPPPESEYELAIVRSPPAPPGDRLVVVGAVIGTLLVQAALLAIGAGAWFLFGAAAEVVLR